MLRIALKAVALALVVLLAGFIVEDDVRLLANSTLEPAVIGGCTYKHVRRVKRRTTTTVYASVAYTRSGVEARGHFIHPSRARCEKRIYRDVSVFVHDFDKSRNRINGFFDFWIPLAFVGVGLMLLLLWLLYRVTRNRVFQFMATVFAVAVPVGVAVAYWHDFESTPKSALQQAGDTTDSASGFSANVLEQCIQSTIREGGYQHKSDVYKLSCQDMGITDLSALAGLNGLEKLYLQGNKLRTLDSLPMLPSLRVLSIASNKTESLVGIENAPNLRELQSNMNKVSSIDELGVLEQLETVAFMYSNISDLAPLAALKHLKAVNFNYNNISDISPLAGNAALSEVNMFSNAITDISPLYNSEGLSSLALVGSKNRIPCAQVEHLLGKRSVKIHESWRRHCQK